MLQTKTGGPLPARPRIHFPIRRELEVVALFTVIADVETGGFGFSTWTEADDRFDNHGDDDGSNDRDHQRDADGLQLLDHKAIANQLGQTAFDSGGIHIGDVAVNGSGGEHAGQDRTQGAADGVNAECVERVVIAELGFEMHHEDVGNDGGENTNDHRTGGIHETASRSDDNQAGDNTGAHAKDGGVSLEDFFNDGPDETGGGGGKRSGHEGVGGDSVGSD